MWSCPAGEEDRSGMGDAEETFCQSHSVMRASNKVNVFMDNRNPAIKERSSYLQTVTLDLLNVNTSASLRVLGEIF